MGSYDLDKDTRLSEETTVLVESYTVSDTLLYLMCPIHCVGFLAPRRANHQSRIGAL